MDEIRRTLDMLLGTNRNGDKPDYEVKDFLDGKICKFDICGLCPYQLFPNTKLDIGECPFEICPAGEQFQIQYNEEKSKGRKFNFERDWEDLLYGLIRKCDDRIMRKKRRRQFSNNSIYAEPEELKALRRKLVTMTEQVEELGMEGKMEEADKLLNEMDALKKEIENQESRVPVKPKEQRLVVCEVCSALLSEEETDQRLADHFSGKGHIGYQKIREKVKELRENRDRRKIESSSYYKRSTSLRDSKDVKESMDSRDRKDRRESREHSSNSHHSHRDHSHRDHSHRDHGRDSGNRRESRDSRSRSRDGLGGQERGRDGGRTIPIPVAIPTPVSEQKPKIKKEKEEKEEEGVTFPYSHYSSGISGDSGRDRSGGRGRGRGGGMRRGGRGGFSGDGNRYRRDDFRGRDRDRDRDDRGRRDRDRDRGRDRGRDEYITGRKRGRDRDDFNEYERDSRRRR